MGKNKHTPLSRHKKKGTKLLGPMSSFRIEPVDWAKDLLPEHLWIAALATDYGVSSFHRPFNDFLDAIDASWHHKDTCLGLLSDFGLFPVDKRQEFLRKHSSLIEEVFRRRVGRALSLYPECPAAWLLSDEAGDREPVDPFAELGYLRKIVSSLLDGKDEFGGRVRSVALNRLFKHDKLKIAADLSVVPLLERYPTGCSEDERAQVEAFARSTLNMVMPQRETFRDRHWPKYFWRHNYDLVLCRPVEFKVERETPKNSATLERIEAILNGNAAKADAYLDLLSSRLRIDLYDPLRDEVLFGLFARITRIFSLLSRDPNLWARDMSGITLRCLVETVITFAYLAAYGTDEEFNDFKRYGEGQEKLLMLHLQDNHPDSQSLEGLNSEDLSKRLGGFSAELLDIELGHWTKQDTRSLAKKVGLEDLYRLVFAPTSSDLHGTWLSIQTSNLIHCTEPLHRFHRLPSSVAPLFFVPTAETARRIYEKALEFGIARRSYPPPEVALEAIQFEASASVDAQKKED